jgi:hypothetical protein
VLRLMRYSVICTSCMYRCTYPTRWEADVDAASHLRDNPTHSVRVVEERGSESRPGRSVLDAIPSGLPLRHLAAPGPMSDPASASAVHDVREVHDAAMRDLQARVHGRRATPRAIRALEKVAGIRGRRGFRDARPRDGDTAARGAERRRRAPLGLRAGRARYGGRGLELDRSIPTRCRTRRVP